PHPAGAPQSTSRLDELERNHIIDILHREKWNKARAARTLGIHRRKLYRLLERYGITDYRLSPIRAAAAAVRRPD
ncbi:MAG: helix-turn-helix domain-containing protein, partial [Planctomycetaceae bacterium]|nr:helix-turn-helix domain-containing protein [Planctomycetaceae bacterium]